MSSEKLLQDLTAVLQQTRRALPDGFVPLLLGERPIGWLRPDLAAFISSYADWPRTDRGVQAVDGGQASNTRSFQALALVLRQAGYVPGWHDEAYTLYDDEGRELLRMERAAFRVFGLHTRAVHVNGYTVRRTLWLGRRSPGRTGSPGMFETLAAGGIGASESKLECILRELDDAAGVPATIGAHVIPEGKIRMRRVDPEGLHDEDLYIYDLLLPTDFHPASHDGEIAEFIEVSVQEAARRVLAQELTTDAAAVTAHFLLRHRDWLQSD